MPIVKDIDAKLFYITESISASDYDISHLFEIASNNSILIEDSTNSNLWLNNQLHDLTTLVPKFDSYPQAFKHLRKNILNNFCQATLLTTNPTLKVSHDLNDTQNKKQDLAPAKYNTWGYASNLNPTETFGDIYSFTISNNDYIAYTYDSHHIVDDDTRTYAQPFLHLVRTDDYKTVIEESTYTLDTVSENGTFKIIYIDETNSKIYLHYIKNRLDTTIGTSSGGVDDYYVRLIVLDIATSPLSLTETIITSNIFAGDTNELFSDALNVLPLSLFWAGFDNNNNNVFIELLNRDSLAWQFVAWNLDLTGQTPAKSTTQTPTISFSRADAAETTLNNPVMSKFLQSPNAQETNKFYSFIPSYDSNNNFTPIHVTWDKNQNIAQSQNAFSIGAILNTQTTYPQGTTSVTYSPGSLYKLNNAGFNLGSALHFTNVRTVLSKVASDYFLTVFTTFKRTDILQAYNTLDPTSSNAVVYKVTSIDTTPVSNITLTYHSHFQLNALDAIVTGSNQNELKVITPTHLNFYELQVANNIASWVNTSTTQGIFSAYTKDSLGRHWATSQAIQSYDNATEEQSFLSDRLKIINPQIKLHLIDETIPHRTSIVFQTTTQTYAGNDLSNNLLVNAYDANSNRIAVDVKLTIEGSNMTFDSNSGTTLTVTTSTIQDTVVPVTITGAGYINVSASFDV